MSASRHRGPSRSSECWTGERLEALTELWLGGASATTIAATLGGVSRSAVLGKIHRLGLGRPAAAPPAKPATPRAKRPRRSRARPALSPPASTAGMRREVPRLTRPVRTLIVAANGNIYVAPPPVELPPMRVVEAENPKSLLQLERGECHHPINDGDHPRHGWLYCGEPVTGSGEYCARCRSILFDHERTALARRRRPS